MTETARRLRREMTPAEQRLWQVVRNGGCGPRFLRQVPAGQYFLDFYCASLRFAVEVDGAIHDVPEVAERDRWREVQLSEDLKVAVARLTNSEVIGAQDDEDLRERVRALIAERIPTAPAWNDRPPRRR
ncbi:MAG TPA: DUF559 domain-containing protein [Armatimonadaceae bacterium]|nr:DUF559 domain-containing protein [Armatimonadaceae bacterium]